MTGLADNKTFAKVFWGLVFGVLSVLLWGFALFLIIPPLINGEIVSPIIGAGFGYIAYKMWPGRA